MVFLDSCIVIDYINGRMDIPDEDNLSHDMTIYDGIIAATCMVYDLPLRTHNKKDFKFLDVILEK